MSSQYEELFGGAYVGRPRYNEKSAGAPTGDPQITEKARRRATRVLRVLHQEEYEELMAEEAKHLQSEGVSTP